MGKTIFGVISPRRVFDLSVSEGSAFPIRPKNLGRASRRSPPWWAEPYPASSSCRAGTPAVAGCQPSDSHKVFLFRELSCPFVAECSACGLLATKSHEKPRNGRGKRYRHVSGLAAARRPTVGADPRVCPSTAGEHMGSPLHLPFSDAPTFLGRARPRGNGPPS